MFAKCSVVAICLLMCPRRSIEIDKGQLKPNLAYIQQYDRNPWSSPQDLPKTHFDEPGFDLTPQEMEKFKIWPGGVIPYYIDLLSFDQVLRDRLRSFLQHSSGLTGLRFTELMVPPSDDARWVFFINRRGVLDCWRYTTKDFSTTGVQKVVLGYDCLSNEMSPAGTILALVGVPPQNNHPQRDKYIRVVTENIIPDKQDLFTRLQDNEWIFDDDFHYDFASAGHFHFHEYSANGHATIIPKSDGNEDVGGNKFYSNIDIRKVRALYNFIISKNKDNRGRVSQCQELFLPGKKNNNLIPNLQKTVQPREKSPRYLGIKRYNEKNNDGEDANQKDVIDVDNAIAEPEVDNNAEEDSNIDTDDENNKIAATNPADDKDIGLDTHER